MPRRFRFSLRAMLVVMLVVAVACAIWVSLPVPIKVAIVGLPLAWLAHLDFIDLLLPPYGSERPKDAPKYVIKWRRRGEKTSRE